MGQPNFLDFSVDHQLGASYGQALAAVGSSTASLRQAVLLDLLGADRSMWQVLRHLIEQPGFDALRSNSSVAARLAGRQAWLQELASWCNEESLLRAGEFLEGLLQLNNHPKAAQPAGPHQPTHEPTGGFRKTHSQDNPDPVGQSSSDQPSGTKGSDSGGSTGTRDAEVQRLSDQGIKASNHGEHHQAIALFSEALRHDGSNALLYMQRASVQAMIGQTEAAIYDFNAVLRLQPSNLEALAQRGQANAALGLMDKAKRDWLEASQRGHREAGKWLKRQLQAEHKKATTEAQQQQNNSARQTGSSSRASGTSSSGGTSAEQTRQQADRFYQKGIAARDRAELKDALAFFNQALQYDSSRADIYAQTAALHAQSGNLELAKENLSTVLRLDPDNCEALAQRGKIHEGLGNLDLARRDWQAAADQGHPEARLWISSDLYRRARREAERNNHRHAVALIGKVIGNGCARPEDHLLRGKSWMALNEYQTAYYDFSKILLVEPENTEALLQRGYCLFAMNRHEEARLDWQKASALGHPDVPKAPDRPGATNENVIVIAYVLGLLCLGLSIAVFVFGWPHYVSVGFLCAAGSAFNAGTRRKH